MTFLLGLLGNRFVVQTVLISLAIASALAYVKWTQHTIDKLRSERAQLEIAVETQQRTIDKIQVDFVQITQSRDRVASELSQARKERDELRETLFRETRGRLALEELARAKPKLIEKAVNNGTSDVLKCLETISNQEQCE